MAIARIAAEYNPFHWGHAWHIARTRRTLGVDTVVVCIVSGHWIQWGEYVLMNRWSRAALALSDGADLALELPTPWTMTSAEAPARGAVGLLVAAGVVGVPSFDSETGELVPLQAAAAVLGGPDYPEQLRAGLTRGLSFPAVRQAAVGADCLASLSDNLRVEYLQTLLPGMEALTIPRRGVVHDGPAAGGFASTSELRALLRTGWVTEADLHPSAPWGGEAASMAHTDRAVLARLRTTDEADWTAPPNGGAAGGLPTRPARSTWTTDGLEDFYARTKTRRYPHARLQRLTLAAFLRPRVTRRPPATPCVRVLGLSGQGQKLLRRMKKTCALPVVIKPAQARALDGGARALFEMETRRTDLSGLCFPTARPCGLEWTRSLAVEERQG